MALLNTEIDRSVAAAIMQASPDGIILTDEQDRIAEFNSTAEQIFGYKRADAIGRLLRELIIAPEDREAYQRARQQNRQQMQRPDSGQRLEFTGLRIDHTTFPIELTMITANSQRGIIQVAFIRDISRRKASDDQLRRVGARLANLVRNLQGGVVLINEKRRIELVNAEFCAMFNIVAAPEELIGESSVEIIDHMVNLVLNPAMFQHRVQELSTTRQIALNDVIHLAHGRVLSRDFLPIYDNGVYLGSLTHFRDVTKEFETRKRWEKLLNLEELNKEIIRIFLQIDDADEAVSLALSLVGQLLDVSRAYIFRFRETERLLDNTHEWCAPNVKAQIDSMKAIAFEELMPSLFPMLTRDSVIAPYHVSTLPADLRQMLEIRNVESMMILPLYSAGRIEGLIGCDENRYPREWLPEEIASFRLIAESYARALERQNIERDLVEARDTALRTAQIRSQFVANMSHEIRTPMTGVLGMLELLSETQLNEDQREFAETAFNSAERLLDIINDILDFSKLDAGFVVLETEPMVLADIANEVKSTLAMQKKHRGVDIRVSIAPEIPARVKGDPTRLRQILMNLAGNAVKFTHEGYVEIRLRLLAIQGNVVRIRFEVADTGIGIDQANIDSIFDSFVQVDGSITRKYGGTGLGLSITRKLIELMGGKIQVESVVGQGSRFYFDLSLPAVSSTASLAELTQRTQFEELNLLVIENEPSARYVFTQQLKRYLVNTTALSCDEVLALIQNPASNAARYDLIFVAETSAGCLPSVDVLRDLTSTYSIERIITLVDQASSGPRPNQLTRPVRHADLYEILLQATPEVIEEALPDFSDVELTNEPSVIEARGRENPVAETRPYDGNAFTEVKPVAAQKRILMAEDYPLNAKLVANALAQENWKLDIVENGLQALEQLERVPYDLVLMDIQMPVMNGLEASQWIRNSTTAYRSIPILALTASVMKEERENYLQSGINEVIVKPFSLTDLRETIRHWLSIPPAPQN